MDGEWKNLIKVWTVAATALFYCYYIASRIPKGTLRFISILPVIYLFIILPLHLTSFHFCSITVALLVGLANIKLLLFSFHKGPLSPPPSIVFIFIAIAILPFKLTRELQNTTTNTSSNPPNSYLPGFFVCGVNLLILVLSIYSFINYKNQMHPLVLLFVCGCFLYIELIIILAIGKVIARDILGFQILPMHNHPYLSTSLQDFWSRRWNPIVNNYLRTIVYSPTWRFLTPIIGSTSALLAAIFVTFVLSGVLHEVVFFYLTRTSPTWEVTCFFVLHGACVALEVAVKAVVSGRWRLHPAISGSLTTLFTSVTAYWLFMHQVLRDGMDKKIITECSILVSFFTERIKIP